MHFVSHAWTQCWCKKKTHSPNINKTSLVFIILVLFYSVLFYLVLKVEFVGNKAATVIRDIMTSHRVVIVCN